MSAPAMPNRPLLRYHGGKFRLADWIIGQMPKHAVYCEPFGGGGSVLLKKSRVGTECYNDLSQEVVTVFRVMQDKNKAAELQRKIKYTPFSRDEFDLAYEHTDDEIELARRVMIRSWFGFGTSGMRASSKNGFRSFERGHGRSPAAAWSDYEAILPAYCERLQGVYIENRPALDVMRKFDSDDTLFYVDPPYVHETRSGIASGGKYYEHEMTNADHEELLQYLLGVQGRVMISGYDCDIYNDLLKGWSKNSKTTQAAGHRGAVSRTEVLWLSPDIEVGTGLFGGAA